MKKLIILSTLTFALFTISCKNEEKAAEEAVSVETAVEQMTEAVADTNAVAPVATDSAAKH